jgi:hypothetical protein
VRLPRNSRAQPDRSEGEGCWYDPALFLTNFTPYPALLTRFAATSDVMGGALVARVTYEIGDTSLTPSTEQTWIVSPKPWDSAYGPMEADEAFYKGGTDVIVFGSARAPAHRPVTRLSVLIEVGKTFRREVYVFGERAWVPRGNQVAISTSQPFVEMPLDMAHAYGGTAEWDGLQVPCSDNPVGKGFFLEKAQAVGKRLPNIEDPLTLISGWDSRPIPVGVGVCPQSFSTRLKAGVTFDRNGALKKLHPRLFNAAYPEMVAENVSPGDQVRVTGVSHSGPLTFSLPAIPVALRLSLDNEKIVRLPKIDQIGVEVDQRRAFITYRHPFRYVLYERQQRKAELFMAEGG